MTKPRSSSGNDDIVEDAKTEVENVDVVIQKEKSQKEISDEKKT